MSKTCFVITRDILELLIESDLVIADLSDRNPNVMYNSACVTRLASQWC